MDLRNDFSGSRLSYYDESRTSGSLDGFLANHRVIDPCALYDFLLYGTILPPRSPLASVQQLYPGETLEKGASHLAYEDLKYAPARKTIEEFVDAFDSLLKEYITARPEVRAVLLSGGIDSAVIASYMSKDAQCLTWGGRGKDTLDVMYSSVTARALGMKEHHFEYADYDRDLEAYKDIVRTLKIPVLFNSAVPFIRLAEAGKKLGVQSWFMGQNADTLFMAYPAPIYTKRLSILNSLLPYNPLSLIAPGEKGYLFSTPSIVRLLAYFKSLGAFPGPWISVPEEYFEEKERVLKRLPTRNRQQAIIMTEELLTEARRNQICQQEIPALFDITAHCPYYEKAFVELALQVPPALRAKKGYTKYILKALAKKRGIPHEVIYKNKSGLSYGFKEVMEQGRHLPVWDAMEKDEDLNRIVRVAQLRPRKENNYFTFVMLMSLHYWFELVARPQGLKLPESL